MIITCASCLTKFSLDDSRIPSKGVKVRCSRCHHVFYVVPPPETKEEVMQGFESFAKYHEDLMVPGEEPTRRPKQEEEAKEPLPSQKEKEDVPVKVEPTEPQAPEPSAPVVASPGRKEADILFEEKSEEKPEREAKVFLEEKKAEEIFSPPKSVSRKMGKRGPSPFLAILFVLLLLILGLFYFWSEMGSGGRLSPYLNTPIQKIKGVWEKVWGTEKEGLDIGDLTGYEEKVGDLSLFVIEGKVSNQSRHARSHVRVKVILFDQDKVKMAEKEAFCGRVLSRQELKGQPPAFFKGDMIVKPQTDTEREVPAGRVAPFMVIFRDPSNQAKEFKVEIIEAPNL